MAESIAGAVMDMQRRYFDDEPLSRKDFNHLISLALKAAGDAGRLRGYIFGTLPEEERERVADELGMDAPAPFTHIEFPVSALPEGSDEVAIAGNWETLVAHGAHAARWASMVEGAVGSLAPTGAGVDLNMPIVGPDGGFVIRQIVAVEYTVLGVRRLEMLVTEVSV